ncbi:MAG TPA: hypothetical protein VF713_14630 [Thermoanaerobaculia bacterium]
MTEVSTFRLYLLRGTYLLIFVFLASSIWPLIIHHTKPWSLMHGVACCLLAAMAPLVALGIRYPLQMLPVLLFELLWKSIWLIAIALPLWQAHQIDPDTAETVKACLMGWVIFPIVIPWPYVFANYVKKAGDRWR